MQDFTLNQRTLRHLEKALSDTQSLNLVTHDLPGIGRIIDFGVKACGGIQAGTLLSEICMGGLAKVNLVTSIGNQDSRNAEWKYMPAIQVATDQPLLACMACQYAGWPISVGKYFAMGSGPMRLNRGREPVLDKYELSGTESALIGVLESNELPGNDVFDLVTRECRLSEFKRDETAANKGGATPPWITLCVAPTASLAGMIQIVARSVEATMHKLFELDFNLRLVKHAWGLAPLPPSGGNALTAIGRSNDAILYGGEVQLWLDTSDQEIDSLAVSVPSNSSPDYGRPFREIYERAGHDFYAIDKLLFSAARVTLTSVRTGYTKTGGRIAADLLADSFADYE
ncbi:MAG TPA: methenyltetrahydromethanopterin cyclohydrolase [Pirellulaceae bacterium]|nr:methenyltetrahydromethanopterin cyclohydrolase [Pirellulaceae bacterium]HMO92135.1 methenyltetrahydromethanopterin cyclohydrolase [Pirellulaceae bacterium]HMP68940.1 methenyltetrahydromethanopterin cyclohydrolase [Pirellulaceae bacterium]